MNGIRRVRARNKEIHKAMVTGVCGGIQTASDLAEFMYKHLTQLVFMKYSYHNIKNTR